MELAKGASINGDCFEMLYLDEDAQIRFTKVPPDGCIYICETGYNTPMAAIRIVYSKDKDKNIIKKVEFWTAQDCWYSAASTAARWSCWTSGSTIGGMCPLWSTSTTRSARGTLKA